VSIVVIHTWTVAVAAVAAVHRGGGQGGGQVHGLDLRGVEG
jgi:hypothetical protein